MRKNVLFSLLAGLALAAPMVASASDHDADLSYTYVEGGYLHVEGPFGVDADGAYLRGSYEFGQSGFYLQGAYSDASTDIFDIDPKTSEIGLGYHYSFTKNIDGLVEVAYQNTDTDFGDADGYRASVGMRAKMGEKWEGLAKVNHYDGGDFVSNTSGTLGVQYRVTPTWGVVGEVEFDGDAETYLVGVRATF